MRLAQLALAANGSRKARAISPSVSSTGGTLPAKTARTSHSDAVSVVPFRTINHPAGSPVGSTRALIRRVSPAESIASGATSDDPSWARTPTPTSPRRHVTSASTPIAASGKPRGNPTAFCQGAVPVTIRAPPLLRGSNAAPWLTAGESSASRWIGALPPGPRSADLTVPVVWRASLARSQTRCRRSSSGLSAAARSTNDSNRGPGPSISRIDSAAQQ